jgi:ABC-type amino acid transport substrate-binding protein
MNALWQKLVTITLLCFIVSFASAETLNLHIVGDDSAKPKNWLDSNGQPTGIMVDLLAEITERTSIEFTYELAPWNRSLKLSSEGRGAIIGFSKTAEREKTWDYSIPMYFDELVFVTSKTKQFSFENLDSLKGMRLAIKRGASYGDDFESAREKGSFVVTETTDRTGQMRMLSLDRVDAILLSPGKLALESIIHENKWLEEHRNSFVVIEPPYKRDPNYLGIPKSMNKSHLLPLINQALKEINTDGTYKKIVDRNIQKVIDQFDQ